MEIISETNYLFLEDDGLLFNTFDDTDGNGLFHVSDGESSKRWVLIEGFNAHWFLGNHSNHGGITGFDGLWFGFNNFTSSSVDFAFNFIEFASNMGSVAIKDWSISLLDLTWVVQYNNLSQEVGGVLSWIVLRIRSDISSSEIFD